MSPNKPEYYNVNLYILSPVHVGTGQELDPFSFVIKNNVLYLVDLINWIGAYPEKEQLHRMMNSDSFAQVRSYIAEKIDPTECMRCEISVDSPVLTKNYDQCIQEKDPRNQILIEPMPRNDVTMEAYIPGSSIKGAIRTAIANCFAKTVGVTSGDKGRRGADYNKKIFGTIQKDPMRWIKVSDVPLGNQRTVIVEAREFSRNPKKSLTPKGHVEAALSLCQTKESICSPLKISMAPFELHGMSVDIDFLLDSLYQFYVPKYVEEYNKFYASRNAAGIQRAISPANGVVRDMKTNEALMRVGHFSHIECVTLDKVRNPITRRGRNGKPLPWGTTRTLAKGLYPFGWVKLEFVQLEGKPRPKKEWPFEAEAAEHTSVPKAVRPRKPLTRAFPKSKPYHAKQPGFDELLKQLEVIQPNDKIGMERMVKFLNNFEDEEQQKAFAEQIMKKLKASGLWKKHRLKYEIEIYL